MERSIPEADWKLLRRLEPLALDRFCQRALAAVRDVAADDRQTHHARYRAVFRLLAEGDFTQRIEHSPRLPCTVLIIEVDNE